MTSLIARNLVLPGRLKHSDFEAVGGAMIALIGPNGGGKTSLLRALAGVEDAAGKVVIDGEHVGSASEARRRSLLAFVPASRDLGWPIAVRDVIALGLPRRDDARIDELVDEFELQALSRRPLTSLSTGERSRVLLARALAARPRLILLDEPLANLEPYWVIRIAEILRAEADAGAIVMVALHDLGQLDRFDRALLMDGGAIQMDEAPDRLLASERFETIFRVRAAANGWMLRPADRQSSR